MSGEGACRQRTSMANAEEVARRTSFTTWRPSYHTAFDKDWRQPQKKKTQRHPLQDLGRWPTSARLLPSPTPSLQSDNNVSSSVSALAVRDGVVACISHHSLFLLPRVCLDLLNNMPFQLIGTAARLSIASVTTFPTGTAAVDTHERSRD